MKRLADSSRAATTAAQQRTGTVRILPELETDRHGGGLYELEKAQAEDPMLCQVRDRGCLGRPRVLVIGLFALLALFRSVLGIRKDLRPDESSEKLVRRTVGR